MELRIGVSGWRYAGWRGVFYPKELPQRRELEFIASQFNTVEINGSFYSLQRPESYVAWRDATPAGFLFAVKGSRYITHMRRLRDIERPLANFFASGVLELREKLGPFLWQFPANFRFDERLEPFLQKLPRTQREAVQLAKLHDDRVASFTPPDVPDHPLRHTVEVRSPTFKDPEFVGLLRRYQIGLVVADTPAFPLFEDMTADFVYVRLHGGEKLYESSYSPTALDHWAARVRSWAAGREPRDAERVAPRTSPAVSRDVYVYFDNDIKVKAPYDAQNLAERLSLKWRPKFTPR